MWIKYASTRAISEGGQSQGGSGTPAGAEGSPFVLASMPALWNRIFWRDTAVQRQRPWRDSALYHAALLEKYDFTDIVLSMKSSHVPTMVEAYRLDRGRLRLSAAFGGYRGGNRTSGDHQIRRGHRSAFIGWHRRHYPRLAHRRSHTEVEAARDLLAALDIRRDGPRLVSCPTCGRTGIDLIGIAQEVEQRLRSVREALDGSSDGMYRQWPGGG